MTRNSIRNEAEQFAAEARAIAIHRVKSTPQEIYDDCADLYAAKIAQMNFASRLAFDLAFVDAMVEQAKDDFRKARPDSFAENQVSFFALDEDFTSHSLCLLRTLSL